jgi:UDP-N-acetylmuramate dehydrogenase
MLKHFNLQSYNTFGFQVNCDFFVTVTNENEFKSYLSNTPKNQKHVVLGGGSNVLFTKDFDGTVIWNQITGIETVKENDEHIWLKVGAGEFWHQFVLHCVANNYSGIENLSLIPGYVGAAPMQNIGAYGVEVKDVCESVEFIAFETGEKQTLNAEDCQFGYRESVFKQKLKNKVFITHVTFKLNKKHKLNTQYGAIEQELQANGITNPSIKDISNAVIAIRSSKLPDPKQIGNAGSFFKNPVISTNEAAQLVKKHPNIAIYPTDNGVKVAAGWLIENAGWKGISKGCVGVHKKQALVLVHYGNGAGAEIVNLSQDILDDVFNKYGIKLEREVNLID